MLVHNALLNLVICCLRLFLHVYDFFECHYQPPYDFVLSPSAAINDPTYSKLFTLFIYSYITLNEHSLVQHIILILYLCLLYLLLIIIKHRFLLCESHNSLSIFVVSSFNDLEIKKRIIKRSVMANSGGTYGHN